MIRRVLAFAVLTAAACSSRSDSSGAVPWRTVFDSTGDTIVARTTGEVPNELIRHLVLEQRIGEAEGNDTVTFGQVWYVRPTRDNRIYAFDLQGSSIKLFDSTGKFIRFVGRKGSGPGEFESVGGMDVLPNDGVALWDASHARVNIYDSRGDFIVQWRVPVSGFYSTNGLTTDQTGKVVLAVPLTDKPLGESGFLRFSETGTIHDTVRIPRWRDSIPRVLGTASGGQVMVAVGLPMAPTRQDAWSPIGALVSGPSTPFIVYVTEGSGRPLKIEREWKPSPVLPEEKEYWREYVTWQIRWSIPNWKGPINDIPDTKPAYSGFHISRDGRIWVSLHSLAERVEKPDSFSASGGMAPPPVVRFKEPNVFDVFESNGTYLGRVRADGRAEIMSMKGDRVWGVLTDSLGVAYVARWRVEPPLSARNGNPGANR